MRTCIFGIRRECFTSERREHRSLIKAKRNSRDAKASTRKFNETNEGEKSQMGINTSIRS